MPDAKPPSDAVRRALAAWEAESLGPALAQAGERKPAFRSQEEIYRETVEAVRRAELSARTVFEPHLPDPADR